MYKVWKKTTLCDKWNKTVLYTYEVLGVHYSSGTKSDWMCWFHSVNKNWIYCVIITKHTSASYVITEQKLGKKHQTSEIVEHVKAADEAKNSFGHNSPLIVN